MIPVLATPILNGTYWLHRLLASVDYPVETFAIFNNGNKEIVEELNDLSRTKHPYIVNIEVCHLPNNIGVSAAWNLIIKSYLNSPYWLIVNHDICFTNGFLEKIWNKAQEQNIGIINASRDSFDCFLLKDWVIQKIGLFDENFSPAYCEDIDYILRIIHYNSKNIDTITGVCIDCPNGEHPYYHGNFLTTDEDCYAKGGSQTKKYSSDIFDKLNQIQQINNDYMNNKWGVDWNFLLNQRLSNLEPIPDILLIESIDYKNFNLEFVRKKYSII